MLKEAVGIQLKFNGGVPYATEVSAYSCFISPLHIAVSLLRKMDSSGFTSIVIVAVALHEFASVRVTL